MADSKQLTATPVALLNSSYSTNYRKLSNNRKIKKNITETSFLDIQESSLFTLSRENGKAQDEQLLNTY